MAKRATSGLNKRKSIKETIIPQESVSKIHANFRTSQSEGVSSGRESYSQMIRELISNPAVKYIAGGIAASVLSRLAVNMEEKYPELSKFLRENIDSFEGTLDQYRPASFGRNSHV